MEEKFTDEQRDFLVKEYNSRPLIKDNQLKLIIDDPDYINIKKKTYRTLIGVSIGFLIISLAVGSVFAYTILKDGTLRDLINNTLINEINFTCEKTNCGNTTIIIEPNVCNCNFPSSIYLEVPELINLNLSNST